jgi:hypothetical protein
MAMVPENGAHRAGSDAELLDGIERACVELRMRRQPR